jgi:hypothetical protein
MKDPFANFEFPSEEEINESTRRAKISMTSRAKFKHDPEFKKIKQNGALKTAEIRRIIPVDDYAGLLKEYWGKPHSMETQQIFADRYGVKLNAIDKIVTNFYNTFSADEYAKIKKAYYKKYPSQRSESLKKAHAEMTAEQKAIKDLNISIAQDPVDEQTALAIYKECRLNRDRKHYQSVAKKYLNKNGKKIPWQKVRDITNGHHYATKHFDIEADIKEYNKLVFGTYKFISPLGEVFEFDDRSKCGKWMLEMQFGKNSDRNPLRELALFEKTIPNEPYTCIRRFWKKWTIVNYR